MYKLQQQLPLSICITLVKLLGCRPILLLPSIFPSIRVFFNESVLHIRWPKYWSFSFSISPSVNIQDWFPLGLTGLISLQSEGLSRVFANVIVQKHQFFSAQLSLWSNSHCFVPLLPRAVGKTLWKNPAWCKPWIKHGIGIGGKGESWNANSSHLNGIFYFTRCFSLYCYIWPSQQQFDMHLAI